MSAIKYRPEIDGLRALAILPVLVFHFNPDWLAGGFMGVDVFFVISGYLITSIILAELQVGSFSFYGFWERRVRRIFPALAAMILAMLVLAFVLFFPAEQLSFLGRQSLKVLALISNQYMLTITGDYWGPNAETFPLLHTWSLAVEEQFYLFLPILIFVIYRWWNRKWITPLLCMLAFISFVYCVSQTYVNQPAAFYLLSTRAWELLFGSILATSALYKVSSTKDFKNPGLADIGVVAIIASYFIFDANGFPGWKALVPVLGATLYIGYSASGGYSAKILKSRPLVFIGKISYSLYLWHWPALVFGKQFADLLEIPSIRGWAFVGSILIAIASYHWVEKAGKHIKSIWLPAGLTAGLIIALSLMATYSHRDFRPLRVKKTESKSMLFENVYANQQIESGGNFQFRTYGIDFHQREKRKTANVWGFESVLINENRPAEIIVLGDSHGLMWGSVIERLANTQNIGCIFWTASGASPFLDSSAIAVAKLSSNQRREFNAQKLKSIEIHKPRVVIISTRLDSKWDEHKTEQAIYGMEKLIAKVHEASPSSTVVIIKQPPMAIFGDQNAVQWLGWRDRYFTSDSVAKLDSLNWIRANEYVDCLTEKFSFVKKINVSDLYLNANGRISIIQDGHIVYTDDDHLSEYGVSLAESRIRSVILPLLKKE